MPDDQSTIEHDTKTRITSGPYHTLQIISDVYGRKITVVHRGLGVLLKEPIQPLLLDGVSLVDDVKPRTRNQKKHDRKKQKATEIILGFHQKQYVNLKPRKAPNDTGMNLKKTFRGIDCTFLTLEPTNVVGWSVFGMRRVLHRRRRHGLC